jgi:hypothetical protein
MNKKLFLFIPHPSSFILLFTPSLTVGLPPRPAHAIGLRPKPALDAHNNPASSATASEMESFFMVRLL